MSSPKVTYFITGGNRGIGFNLVKILSSSPSNIVIASTRGSLSLPKNKELQLLTEERKNVFAVQLDIVKDESINDLPNELQRVPSFEGIDVFIANSGISDSYYKALEAPKKVWIDHYTTNALGPILTLQKIYPLLLKKNTRKIFLISSVAGSISGYVPLPISAYGQSKAALNYTMKELSFELKDEGFTVASFHPGLVSSDMGKYGISKFSEGDFDIGKFEVLTPEESASKLIDTFSKIGAEDNGKFLNYDGSEASF